jgi:hypothetical protein
MKECMNAVKEEKTVYANEFRRSNCKYVELIRLTYLVGNIGSVS